ncbi:transposable element Tcb1 transposase [Trichonephila clavipes]|nr:transposable element Tcb1 transposase [Trichonephila clavipes]
MILCVAELLDRYIVLSAKRNRRTTTQQVANKFLAASGKQISRKTVARRLRGGGLYARRPVVCVPLTRQHRTARLQWCREHHNWTEQDWACVLFSDEKNIQEKDGSLVVMAGMSRVQAKYPSCRGTMHIKYVEFKRPPIGVVVRRGVPAQVSSLTIFQNYEDCRQKPSCS